MCVCKPQCVSVAPVEEIGWILLPALVLVGWSPIPIQLTEVLLGNQFISGKNSGCVSALFNFYIYNIFIGQLHSDEELELKGKKMSQFRMTVLIYELKLTATLYNILHRAQTTDQYNMYSKVFYLLTVYSCSITFDWCLQMNVFIHSVINQSIHSSIN